MQERIATSMKPKDLVIWEGSKRQEDQFSSKRSWSHKLSPNLLLIHKRMTLCILSPSHGLLDVGFFRLWEMSLRWGNTTIKHCYSNMLITKDPIYYFIYAVYLNFSLHDFLNRTTTLLPLLLTSLSKIPFINQYSKVGYWYDWSFISLLVIMRLETLNFCL